MLKQGSDEEAFIDDEVPQAENLATTAEEEAPKCYISLTEDTRTDLYLILYGYIQGLYSTANYPDPCKRCQNVALPFSQMVYGLGNVLNLFSEVISDNAFADAGATERLQFLYDSYLLFWDFGINFDRILHDDTAIIQYRQFLGLSDPEYYGAVRKNVQNNLLSLLSLYGNLDFAGKEC